MAKRKTDQALRELAKEAVGAYRAMGAITLPGDPLQAARLRFNSAMIDLGEYLRPVEDDGRNNRRDC